MFFEIIKTTLKLFLGHGGVRSYAQFGEDAVVGSMMRKKKGVYVDVGAFHPILYSNTYALYRRGWRGVAIDPRPNIQTLFKFFRPRDSFHSVGVGNASRGKYFLFNNSAYNTFDNEEADKARTQGVVLMDTRDVEIKPLADILASEHIVEIDVLSIDVEGLDMQVLATHDWNIPTHIIVVEDRDFQIEKKEESECYVFLSAKGYTLKGMCGPSLLFKK